MMQLSTFEFWIVTSAIIGAASVISFAVRRFVKSVDGLTLVVTELKIVVSNTSEGVRLHGEDIIYLKKRTANNVTEIAKIRESVDTLKANEERINKDIDELYDKTEENRLTLNTIRELHKFNHHQDIGQ